MILIILLGKQAWNRTILGKLDDGHINLEQESGDCMKRVWVFHKYSKTPFLILLGWLMEWQQQSLPAQAISFLRTVLIALPSPQFWNSSAAANPQTLPAWTKSAHSESPIPLTSSFGWRILPWDWLIFKMKMEEKALFLFGSQGLKNTNWEF